MSTEEAPGGEAPSPSSLMEEGAQEEMCLSPPRGAQVPQEPISAWPTLSRGLMQLPGPHDSVMSWGPGHAHIPLGPCSGMNGPDQPNSAPQQHP